MALLQRQPATSSASVYSSSYQPVVNQQPAAMKPTGSVAWSRPDSLGAPYLKLGTGTGRRGVPGRPAGAVLCTMSLHSILPWTAAHSPLALESLVGMAPVRDSALQMLECTTGSWTGAAVLWTLVSMLTYAARRSHLHGLSVPTILARHFINGFDEPPHPYFAVSQKVPTWVSI